MRDPSEPAFRGFWIWPIRIPPRIGRRTYAAAVGFGERLGPVWRWLLVGALAGALPLAWDFVFGGTSGRPVTAVALGGMLAAAAVRDDAGRGMGALASAFAAHCLLALGLAVATPERLARAQPGGPEYWEESRTWIVTGVNPEYKLSIWAPTHVATFLGATVFSYLSLGASTVLVGLQQVDVMCFYAGRLAASSVDPATAVALGWHPWSVCRGVGFVVLTFEVVSLSLSRMTGRRLSTGRRRAIRWAVGLGFLLLDGGLKLALMEPVRAVLASNLR